MVPEKESRKISKFMSYVLRHHPESIGLALDEGGWADVGDLVEKMNGHGIAITREELQYLVATNSKQRFAFDKTGTRIRASQGHSVDVSLGLTVAEPPLLLYHGTGEKAVSSILASGLEKRSRHHVHLSPDVATAVAVGQRHGRPRVLVVRAGEMHRDGHTFYCSENGVWLTESVPARYLGLADEGPGAGTGRMPGRPDSAGNS